MIRLTDGVTLDEEKTRTIEGGYMVCVARAVRTGIQDYAGFEVGRPDLKIVKVYRDASEVFSDASLQSFSHAPITDDHPKEMVDAKNWSKLAKGEVSTAAKKDGEWVQLPLIFKDAQAISDIKSGKSQLSAGYLCELDWTPGVTKSGEAYDARQTNIRINHVAVVDAARAGPDARINDGARTWGASPLLSGKDSSGGSHMTDKVLQKVMFDGLSIETTDQGAQAITKLQAKIDAMTAELAAKDASFEEMKKKKAEEIAKKDVEIDGLKDKVLTGDAIDARVAARGDLVSKIRSMDAAIKIEGVSDSDLKKAIVDKRKPDVAAKVAGKDAVYVAAYYDHAFDALSVETVDHFDVRRAFEHSVPTITKDGGNLQQAAFDKSVSDLNAWRTAKK